VLHRGLFCPSHRGHHPFPSPPDVQRGKLLMSCHPHVTTAPSALIITSSCQQAGPLLRAFHSDRAAGDSRTRHHHGRRAPSAALQQQEAAAAAMRPQQQQPGRQVACTQRPAPYRCAAHAQDCARVAQRSRSLLPRRRRRAREALLGHLSGLFPLADAGLGVVVVGPALRVRQLLLQREHNDISWSWHDEVCARHAKQSAAE